MHGQVESTLEVNLGHSPNWFPDLWQNPQSRFLVKIDFANPPAWLVHLHETTPDINIIPEHLLLHYQTDEEFIAEQEANEQRKNRCSPWHFSY